MIAALRSTPHSARGALASFRCNLQVAVQYRANMAVWSVASVLQVVVYLSVWQAVAEARGGSAGGYTAAEFAGYFLVLIVVRDLTMTWLLWELPGHVREGTLAVKLLRPLHPLVDMMASMWAYRVQAVAVSVPTAAVLFAVFDARVDASWGAVAVAALVLPLASMTRILLDSVLATSALWLVRIDGIRGVYYLVLLLLSGQFAPLAVLPDWLATVARVLPFYWTLGYPTELLTGRAPLGEAWIALLVLGGWTTVAFAALQPLWRAGTRAHEAVGS